MIRQVPVPTGCFGLCYLGQAGFFLKSADGHVVCIDPYLSDSQAATDPPERWTRSFPAPVTPHELDANVVLVTHGHGDHFDPETLGPLLAGQDIDVIAPSSLRPAMEALGARFTAAEPGQPIAIGSLTIHPVPACHAVTFAGGQRYRVRPEEASGYVVELPGGIRVYHAGDTVLDPSIEATVAELRPLVALLPINGRDAVRESMDVVGNLTIREAAYLAGRVGARYLIPCHHDLFKANSESVVAFVDALEREFPTQEYVVLKPGRVHVLGPGEEAI